MKSIEELMAIRDNAKKKMNISEEPGDNKIRHVVGMAS